MDIPTPAQNRNICAVLDGGPSQARAATGRTAQERARPADTQATQRGRSAFAVYPAARALVSSLGDRFPDDTIIRGTAKRALSTIDYLIEHPDTPDAELMVKLACAVLRSVITKTRLPTWAHAALSGQC